MACRKTIMNWLLVFCVMFFARVAAAEIVGAEYYIDNDPGAGSGTPLAISASDSVNASIIADLSALGSGPHKFYIRYQDDTGQWGRAVASWFFILPSAASDYEDRALIAAEYYFDNDPGAGNAIQFTLSTGSTIELNTLLQSQTLDPGTHRVFVRYQDDLNRWSEPEGMLFSVTPTTGGNYELRTIIAAEYFFDSDPGVGNGTTIGIASLTEAALSIHDDLTGLLPGSHRFLIRYQDDLGRWSGVEGLRFFLLPESTPLAAQPVIAGAEYFINVDPGVGLGIPLLPDDGIWDEPDETVVHAVSDIPPGKHWIGIRFRDDAGNWSIMLVDSFMVEPILTIRISGGDAILDWITAGDPTTFHVFRSSNSDGGFAEIGTTSDTTYVDNGIIDVSEAEFYQVTRELNTRGESTFRLPARDGTSER